MRGISWLAEGPLGFQKGPCSMELVKKSPTFKSSKLYSVASWIQYKSPYHFPYYTSEYFSHSMTISIHTGLSFRQFPFRSGIALCFGQVSHSAFICRVSQSKNMQATWPAETSETIYRSTSHTHSRRLKCSAKSLQEPRFSLRATYLLTPNLQSCILYIYSTNIGTEYFKHDIYFWFFPSKCSLFNNSNVFGSCIIQILYTGCTKIKKMIPAPKG